MVRTRAFQALDKSSILFGVTNMKEIKPHGSDYHKEFQKHNVFYDAYYCEKCDFWLEDKCGDPRCNYCPQRPEKPSKAYYN